MGRLRDLVLCYVLKGLREAESGQYDKRGMISNRYELRGYLRKVRIGRSGRHSTHMVER